MPKPTDIKVKAARCNTQQIDYRAPIKFGGRVVNDVVVFNVELEIETRDGRRATGYGSMTMGNVWAWPTSHLDNTQTLGAMLSFGQSVVDRVESLTTFGHPLEIAHELTSVFSEVAEQVSQGQSLAEGMPPLAQRVAASPVDAALHDAFGRVLEQNAYNLLGEAYCNRDLGSFLNDDFRGEFLDQYTLRQPRRTMPLYHLVGALDPVRDSELQQAVGDGLPETLSDWILADGLTHLKIKLSGDQLDWDVDRVIAVDEVSCQAQAERQCTEWFYSLDFNEKCQDEQYVLEFLDTIRSRSNAAYERIQYIEQPTHRDLAAHPELTMHEVARLKPVVIDESLIGLESLELARQQGYSGVALKACKGHSEALLMGAAAQKYKLFLCVQDLTCIGYSFLHSASLAARLPTIAAIEGNGRQYCPLGNQGWADRYPGMFSVQDGEVATAELSGNGLGFSPMLNA